MIQEPTTNVWGGTNAICDFCGSPDVVTEYKTVPFCVPTCFPDGSDYIDPGDGFAACKICAVLIEAEAWRQLQQRGKRFIQQVSGCQWAEAHRTALLMVKAFQKYRVKELVQQ